VIADGIIPSRLRIAETRSAFVIPSRNPAWSAALIVASLPDSMAEAVGYGSSVTSMPATRLMLMTAPELKMVDLTAEATPRLSGGADRMIELMFGAAKRPSPTPTRASIAAISQYEAVAVIPDRRRRLAPRMPSPTVVRLLDPYRSERDPLTGPTTANVISIGRNIRPASSAPYPLTTCR